VGGQTEQFRDLPITTQPERFQTGVQTPLLFVEQVGKQNDRRPKLVGDIARPDAGRCSGGLIRQRLPCPQLLLPGWKIAGTVQI
jgi:hypothetical protein